MVAAAPRLPNDSANLFEANALICKDLAEQCAIFCPQVTVFEVVANISY